MSIMKRISAFSYHPKTTITHDAIHKELDGYQNKLEKLGFTVRRSEQPVNYEAAVSLSAEKDGITFRVSRYLTGGRDLSVAWSRGGVEKTVSLVPYNFTSALSIACSLQALDR